MKEEIVRCCLSARAVKRFCFGCALFPVNSQGSDPSILQPSWRWFWKGQVGTASEVAFKVASSCRSALERCEMRLQQERAAKSF